MRTASLVSCITLCLVYLTAMLAMAQTSDLEVNRSRWRAAGIDAYGAPGFMVKRVKIKDEPVIVSHLRLHERAGG